MSCYRPWLNLVTTSAMRFMLIQLCVTLKPMFESLLQILDILFVAMWVICGEVPLDWSWTMANDSALLSTASSVFEDVATSNASNTGDFLDDLSTRLWRWVWPLLCVTGLVGNSLVLLVLRQDRLVRTSANVFLTALAVGDSLVLIAASVVVYLIYIWSFWLQITSTSACHTVLC